VVLPDGITLGYTAHELHAQGHSARRTDVKATVGKTKLSAKVQGKPKKAVVAAKPIKKAVTKTVLKASAKPAAKLPPKSVAKPVSKAVGKSTVKPSKPVPSRGGAAKVAVKAPLKAAVNAKINKPATKVAGKSSVKEIPPKAAKPLGKKDLNVKAPVASVKPAPVVTKTAPKPAVVIAPVAAPVAAAAPVASAPVPAKAGRPSSRLAQLTVPSMAQSVASTAAKASYTQTMSLPLIVPPLPSAAKKDPKLANNWKTKPVEQLTDAELMAMPDSEYMNETQMAVFRLKLSVLKQDILNSAGETTEHLREDTVVVPDPADRATIEEEHALELRTRDRERKLLKKIEQSINRIDAGDYGYCDETGEPIGVGRLLARPTATLSLEAQQRRELKQKMFGD